MTVGYRMKSAAAPAERALPAAIPVRSSVIVVGH